MTWIDITKLILGGLFGLVSFFIFATVALFYFADRTADNGPRKPKRKPEIK